MTFVIRRHTAHRLQRRFGGDVASCNIKSTTTGLPYARNSVKYFLFARDVWILCVALGKCVVNFEMNCEMQCLKIQGRRLTNVSAGFCFHLISESRLLCFATLEGNKEYPEIQNTKQNKKMEALYKFIFYLRVGFLCEMVNLVEHF